MFSSVAVVIAALNVNDSVVGLVMLAAVVCTPERFVVYAGIPLHVTGWLNAIVIVDPLLVTLPIPTGVAGMGRPVGGPNGGVPIGGGFGMGPIRGTTRIGSGTTFGGTIIVGGFVGSHGRFVHPGGIDIGSSGFADVIAFKSSLPDCPFFAMGE
jgi:hypothetical protein